jgi:hypothetical protein
VKKMLNQNQKEIAFVSDLADALVDADADADALVDAPVDALVDAEQVIIDAIAALRAVRSVVPAYCYDLHLSHGAGDAPDNGSEEYLDEIDSIVSRAKWSMEGLKDLHKKLFG